MNFYTNKKHLLSLLILWSLCLGSLGGCSISMAMDEWLGPKTGSRAADEALKDNDTETKVTANGEEDTS